MLSVTSTHLLRHIFTRLECMGHALRSITTSTISNRQLLPPLPSDPPSADIATDEHAPTPQSEAVERILSTDLSSSTAFYKQFRQKVMEQFSRFPGDTGSSEVQVAALCARIDQLQSHLITNRKDHVTRRRLTALINKRRGLLMYLRRKDFEAYAGLITRLGFNDSFAKKNRFSWRYSAAKKLPPSADELA